MSIEKILKGKVAEKTIVIKETYKTYKSQLPDPGSRDEGKSKKIIVSSIYGPRTYHGKYIQDALPRAMAGMNVKSVEKFPYIPYMTVEVDAAGLTFLSTFHNITSIKENVPEGLTPVEGVH